MTEIVIRKRKLNLAPSFSTINIVPKSSMVSLEKSPMEITNRPWVHYELNGRGAYGGGKWMVFYPKTEINLKWRQIRNLYSKGKLPGVYGLKCSTGYSNPRESNPDNGVIIVFCNSADDNNIMQVGNNLVLLDPDIPANWIYYKTDNQTWNGTQSTGSVKNHTFRVATQRNLK